MVRSRQFRAGAGPASALVLYGSRSIDGLVTADHPRSSQLFPVNTGIDRDRGEVCASSRVVRAFCELDGAGELARGDGVWGYFVAVRNPRWNDDGVVHIRKRLARGCTENASAALN